LDGFIICRFPDFHSTIGGGRIASTGWFFSA
jgi:hypothetical protein